MKSKLTTHQRGYGASHARRRRVAKRDVDAGSAVCWRCGEGISPGESWDLGHDDDNRRRYRGPEHVKCNRGAPSRLRKQEVLRTEFSRQW